jgi:hypothetical protein
VAAKVKEREKGNPPFIKRALKKNRELVRNSINLRLTMERENF